MDTPRLLFTGEAHGTRCAELGARFHTQVDALELHAPHADDPVHDLMVGQALLLTVEYDAPKVAERVYNEWAESAGYAPCFWLGTWTEYTGTRGWIIDIRIGLILVDAAYRVSRWP